MTQLPPPNLPPPGTPPPHIPERRTPGFALCGLAVFGGFLVLGGIASALTEAVNAEWFSAAVMLSIVAGLIMMSIRDPRLGKCLLKGLVVVVAVFGVLAGACLAILQASGI